MDLTKTPRKVWEHPNPKSTAMWAFMQEANKLHGLNLKTFNDLYQWSVSKRSDFYAQLWASQNWIHEGSYSYVVDESIPITKLPAWFPGIRINYAENLLWTGAIGGAPGERSTLHKEDDTIAITEVREGNSSVKNVTWGELRRRVGELASALKQRGVQKGDRVVMVGAHAVETLVVFLAATWLGGLFSSSSTDMGVGGLLQRTVQIDPKFVFFDDGALYNGKVIDLRDKIEGVVEGMKECPSFQGAIIVQRFDSPHDTSQIPKTQRLESFLSSAPSTPPPIERVGFQDPMVVYYSSGTTGTPKAIVHSVGPILVSVAKEAILHREITPKDVALQYTTTGWIMYLASVTRLAFGGRTVFYDGIVPQKEADLSSLTAVQSTGMVLKEQVFDWFYDGAFPTNIKLANFSGGTDIAACFVMENPLSPIYAGGCPGRVIGTPMAIYPSSPDLDKPILPVPDGEPGDLVGTAAFPNVPLYLWNDTTPAPGKKYTSAYFDRFPNVWSQGDFAAVHPQTGHIHILGRSDGVLNPSGIRFGSADIYAVLEGSFAKEVAESLCVGQRRPQFNAELASRIRERIAKELTKRHVPKYIFEVPDIPTTVNGKKVELPVKQIISGSNIKPSGTLLNPQSLDFFYQFQKIEEIDQVKAKL
ncbi:Acetoacetyl-CoA synthetase [Fusarium oxysporum f. sp. cubense race 1]|uniref:Acetoacetyl-CoA synthetase n=1 Tax=Fusarium oxysporum f. sp. cubense (strain race 1) TaxID=1229664 RepID=N4TYF5_FUSC1|nr:Acetoacetyl-CoA synthetase [Fusarium oxysporum f. sp. cubense race 1]